MTWVNRKNFYDVVCITTDQQSGKKEQTYLGCFTSRKKADEEIRRDENNHRCKQSRC